MNTNQKIAHIFNDMGRLLEIKEVPWKPRAYHQAAQSLEHAPEKVEAIYKKNGLKGLEDIPGVGERLGKIIEYLKTHHIQEYEKLKADIPPGLMGLLAVPGLGPKRIKELLKIHSMQKTAHLKKGLSQNTFSHLPGFSKKIEENLLRNLGLQRKEVNRVSSEFAQKTADQIIFKLEKLPGVETIEALGSLRRKESSVGDIDILLVAHKMSLKTALEAVPFVKDILSQGSQKASILLVNGLKVDLRLFDKKNLGSARLYFTGNKAHNIQLRKIAIKKGLKLNEYGLFDRAGHQLAGETEKEIYEKLGLRFIPPAERQGGQEFEKYLS